MPIIVGESSTGLGGIGYKNLFTEGTVTASTEAVGYEKENAYDWFGYDWWKPTATGDSWLRVSLGGARLADYCSIWGHDLADHSASIKPQYSTDGGSIWNDAAASVMPANNNTLFFSWTGLQAADWRILVTNPTTISVIAGVQIGESLQLPHNLEVGFTPPSLVPMHEIKTARSESGVFIGGSTVSQGIEGSFTLTNIDPVWVRTEWIPFIQHLQSPKPFTFAWDGTTHPTEVVLAWIKAKGKITAPSYSDSLYMTISLEFEGVP